MPQTVEQPPWIEEPTVRRHRMTRAHCGVLYDAGHLVGHYELIDGQILEKNGQSPPHGIGVGLVQDWLTEVFGSAYTRVQLSMGVGRADPEHNEPEPDIVVTNAPRRAYIGQHPQPEDLLLVAEVADSTLGFDRTKKAALYARAAVQEYWILDLQGRQLIVHRQPTPDGYREITAYAANEQVATLARPQALVTVSELLP